MSYWILENPAQRGKLNKHEIIRGMVLGLAKAHEEGNCHRDLHPANILLSEGAGDRPKFADFRLAKVVGDARPTASDQT